jgi:hypothetical protein
MYIHERDLVTFGYSRMLIVIFNNVKGGKKHLKKMKKNRYGKINQLCKLIPVLKLSAVTQF